MEKLGSGTTEASSLRIYQRQKTKIYQGSGSEATQLSSKNSLPISGNGKSGKGKIEKTMVKSDDARNTVMGNSVVKGKAHV
jgi:hypothetical protein